MYDLTHRRMFTSKVWTDDIRLLEESNSTTRQPLQGTTSRYTGNFEWRTCPRSRVVYLRPCRR